MPNEKPYGERIVEAIKPRFETQEELIIRLVNEHKSRIKDITTGQRYYDKQSDILKYKAKLDADGELDIDKPDWRITTNFHQNLVDQKVGYTVGNPVTLSCDNEEVTNQLHEIFDNHWDNKLIDILTAASNKGVEWLQPYIDENGEFKLFRVPAEQAIPIWTDKEREKLQAFIRYYKLNDELKVEYWTDRDVTYYVIEDEQLIPDYYHGENNIQSHFNGGNWGKVPFIPFKNNPEEVSDIFMYKKIIDAIDKRLSDTQNMFDESAELIYILQGYNGEDLKEFMGNLKYYKAINVDSEGGVDTIQVEVPVASTKDYLEMMRAYLMEFGQAVDFQTDKFGNSPSGIALKFLYGNLDLKANKLRNKTQVAIQELLEFVIQHFKLNIKVKDIEITFNYNRMMNELEQSQIGAQSQYLSKETLVTNHPWVTDPHAEIERIDSEQMEYNQQLPSVEEGLNGEQQSENNDPR
ncbi:phage portal protein [Staphylococcus gallinarum]|uniref:phage portal protein n=1 Tax=Staphylococcus gallinarum TaxID=1293 RepID=UPI003F573EA0